MNDRKYFFIEWFQAMRAQSGRAGGRWTRHRRDIAAV